ncbi:protein of unknown function [Cribrihabitans marinus]|uniref:YjiS-like domain-containing protein n=1 Tax=Cribrihabitans marinus TaxID=1227549 RepID=A0A1H6YHB1_9RHOB|nr:DUF1127 domain-containing protein [Cribrihabitans marinus]GGH29251.1 hypothetical protein GCM10010973_18650 [Cribrihabitans marinus]SEJ40698.1 protein of unknown function [Cribrihabitans marinus]
MAQTLTPHAPHGAVTILRAVNAMTAIKEAVIGWNDARKTRNELSRLTDEQLFDIGLTRGDIARF